METTILAAPSWTKITSENSQDKVQLNQLHSKDLVKTCQCRTQCTVILAIYEVPLFVVLLTRHFLCSETPNLGPPSHLIRDHLRTGPTKFRHNFFLGKYNYTKHQMFGSTYSGRICNLNSQLKLVRDSKFHRLYRV